MKEQTYRIKVTCGGKDSCGNVIELPTVGKVRGIVELGLADFANLSVSVDADGVIDGERVVIRTDVQHVDALLSLLPRIDSASLVMVDGIHRDARSRETWQRIVGNNHAAVCYDLYYTGIVMLDQSKHKRCYTINF